MSAVKLLLMILKQQESYKAITESLWCSIQPQTPPRSDAFTASTTTAVVILDRSFALGEVRFQPTEPSTTLLLTFFSTEQKHMQTFQEAVRWCLLKHSWRKEIYFCTPGNMDLFTWTASNASLRNNYTDPRRTEVVFPGLKSHWRLKRGCQRGGRCAVNQYAYP